MKYLVVQTKQIGDVLVSTALCDNLKKHDPSGEVHYLVMDYCAGMAQGNPHIDKVIQIDKSQRNSWRYMWPLLKQLRQEKYDVVINSQGQMIGLLTCLFSGARIRIGFDSFPWRLGHNRIVHFGRDTEHQGNCSLLDDRFALLKPLGLQREDRAYHLWLSDAEIMAAKQQLVLAGVDLQRPLVAMGVNSLGAYKRWALDYFAQVAQWLMEQYGAQILIYAAPNERDYNRQLKPLLPTQWQPFVFDQIETANVRGLAGLMAHCSLFVGNDTGPRHIAQALDLPLLTIVAPKGAKIIANPINHPRYRAIDVWDVIGESQKQQWQSVLEKDGDDQALFRLLTPQHVMAALRALIEEQNPGMHTHPVS